MRAIAAIVLTVFLGSCAPAPSVLDRIITLGELRVVTRNSPTTYFLGAEEPQGVEYELALGFARRLGVELRMYAEDEFWALFPEVTEGRAHIAAAGLTITAPRRELVAFGPAYQHVKPLLIYRMGNHRPASLDDLEGGSLEVVAGSSPVALLNDAQQRNPQLHWSERQTGNVETLIRGVSTGASDYAIVPSNEFAVLQHYYPEARAAFALRSNADIGWALPRGATKLREAVAAYFAEIIATGELEQILERDQHNAHEFDFVGSRAFVRHLHERYPSLEAYFHRAAAETGLDWRLIAAIAYQESHWNPDAVSPTGVRGLMMLTEHTAEIVGITDRNDPWQSVIGGSRYFLRVLNKFPERIPAEDRLWMAAAAYNIGFGHVEDARVITQMQGGNPDSWPDVREHLPLLSDEEWFSQVRRGYAPGTVPVDYVDNVRRYLSLIDWMQGTEFLSGLETEPEGDDTPTEPPLLAPI